MVTSLNRSRMMTIDEVESNEELLIAILIHLPPISIFRFKCVCKRWKSILNDPYFYQSYSARIRLCGNSVGRLLALFQDIMIKCGTVSKYLTTMLPVDQPKEHNIERLPLRFHSLEHCSDGFVICNDSNFRYCVVNPVTRTWVRLPRLEFGQVDYLGLICEENKEMFVPSFRVVGVLATYPVVDKEIVIGTYSSKTGKWEKSKLIGNGKFSVDNICKTFVFKGVLHWYIRLEEKHCLAVYDSNTSEKHVQVINIPLHTYVNFALTRSSKDDVLWVGVGNHRTTKFFKLPKDENKSYKRKSTIAQNEWIMMYTINNNYLSQEMALLLESAGDTVAKSGGFLKLEALIPSSPVVAVLSMGGNLFLHNLETKLTELVRYRGLLLPGTSVSDWNPFMESLFLSTYAPLPRAFD